MDDLTKEQKHLLVSMYKEMLSRKLVLPLREARRFENSDVVRDLFCPDKTSDDVSDLCWALKEKEYIDCYPGDELADEITISDRTINYMENRFKNGLKDIAPFLASLIP